MVAIKTVAVMWVDELKELISPPPGAEGQAPDWYWGAVELALSVDIPPDYKLFCQVWGPGGLLGDEIVCFAPVAPHWSVRFVEAVQTFVRAYAHLKANWPDTYGLPILPAEGSLLPFAIDGNGDYFGWIVGPEPANGWPVAVLAHEDGMPDVTGLTFSSFMLAFARRELETEALHPGFLQLPLTFRPFDPTIS